MRMSRHGRGRFRPRLHRQGGRSTIAVISERNPACRGSRPSQASSSSRGLRSHPCIGGSPCPRSCCHSRSRVTWTAPARKRRKAWRVREDETGHYCFAVTLGWRNLRRAPIGETATPCDLALSLMGAAASRYRWVVPLPFDSGPLDQSRDRRDGPRATVIRSVGTDRQLVRH
jgi:hypothetical protein